MEKGMKLPSHEEVLSAFRAGYQSIDEGGNFYDGFNAFLVSNGYSKVQSVSCTCPDLGRHGHMPECRWMRNAS